MTALSISTVRVAAVKVLEQMTGPAGEAIAAGDVVRLDATSGKFMKAKADTEANGRAIGVSIQNASASGMPITVVTQGWLDLGDALSALDFDDLVYLGNTAGQMGDAAGTVEEHVGRVIPGWSSTTADKLLRLEFAFVPAAA